MTMMVASNQAAFKKQKCAKHCRYIELRRFGIIPETAKHEKRL